MDATTGLGCMDAVAGQRSSATRTLKHCSKSVHKGIETHMPGSKLPNSHLITYHPDFQKWRRNQKKKKDFILKQIPSHVSRTGFHFILHKRLYSCSFQAETQAQDILMFVPPPRSQW